VPAWCDNYLAAAGVAPGERVRIAVDAPFAAEAEELARAVRDLGAEARVACLPSERPMLEPTQELLDTAAWADVSIGLLGKSYVEELPVRRAMIEVLLGRVEGARELRIRGAAGTDLLLRVDGRRWLTDALPLEPGTVANFPGGEICVAPHADGADGVLVVDLTIPFGSKQELLPEPVEIRFEGGRARSIEGGEAGAEFRRLVEDAGKGADVIAELGIGLNPALRPRGNVLFDEKAARTAHVAIGDNTGPYLGDNVATIHVDCVFSEPQLWVDGEPVAIP